MSENDADWPPTFDLELTERQRAIMDAYELMERLTDEYGGRGKIEKVDEGTLAVVLEYDIPEESNE